MGLFWAYFAIDCIIFLFGICLGSFLGVVVDRVPQGESIWKGRSHCPHCMATLGPTELIPLFSFFLLGRRCRHCSAPIPWRLPLTELAGGILAVWLFHHQGSAFTAVYFLELAVAYLLLAIALIDLDTLTIPNGLVLLLAALALVSSFIAPEVGLLTRAIGLVAVSVPMLLLTLCIPGSFGGGDIKLMAACGFLLGWQLTLFATFIALVTGGGYGCYLLLKDRANRTAHFPFGPFLCTGVLLALLYGQRAITWYLGLFSLI